MRISLVMLALMAVTTAASAQKGTPNTIDCAAFKKDSNGAWCAIKPTTFELGGTKQEGLTDICTGPGGMSFGGVDLFTAVEQKCGRR
jgi:hypothetical protein